MWPTDPEAQAYAVAMLAVLAVNVGLLATIGADRRHFRRKFGRQAEDNARREAKLRANLYAAEAELAYRARRADRSLDEYYATTPVATGPRHEAATAVFPAVRSFVVGSEDPDETTFIDARGESTT